MSTNRRTFLKFSAGGAVVGVIGCVPEAPAPSDWRDEVYARDAGPRPVTSRDGGTTTKPTRDGGLPPNPAPRDGGATGEPDAGFVDAGMPPPRDGGCDVVMMHDTYAQALYLDGTYGPLTGTILVDYVLANTDVELEFWHGHGGRNHRFTLLPEHYEQLKRGERVTVTTTEVDSHAHTLFIDPVDPNYRVPGSNDVAVPLC